MQDVQLFQRLPKTYQLNALEAAELTPALEEIARWSLQERIPFLGFIPRLIRHHDPRVRSSAVRLLAGASGNPALRLIIRSLDDVDLDVRRAACEALRVTALQHDSGRWLHVLFHPDPQIRAMAVSTSETFPLPRWQALYLLADPDNAEAARRIVGQDALPVTTLPVIFHLIRQGHLSGPEARSRIMSISLVEVLSLLNTAPRRTPSQRDAILDRLRLPDGDQSLLDDAGAYPTDDWIQPFAEYSPDEDDAVRNWLTEFVQFMVVLGSEDEFACAALIAGWRSGTWQQHLDDVPGPSDTDDAPRRPMPDLAAVLIALRPSALMCDWLPINVRRRGLEAWYEFGSSLPRLDDATIMELLGTEVCRFSDGTLDLWSIGAILHRAGGNGLRLVRERFGTPESGETIRASFEARPARSVGLLRSPHASASSRRVLLRELLVIPRLRRATFMARLARAVPADGLDFLDVLTPADSVEIFHALRPLVETESPRPTARKLRALAEALTGKILAGQVGPFLATWLHEDIHAESELGLMILARLARAENGRFLIQAIRSLEPTQRLSLIRAVTHSPGFPAIREQDVARELRGDLDPDVIEWVERRLAPVGKETDQPVVPTAKAGLCAELRGRPDPDCYDRSISLALLGCHDTLEDVDAQFSRFGPRDEASFRDFDENVVATLLQELDLSPAGHAWLYRWDVHLERFALTIDDLPTALIRFAGLISPLRERCWLAVARLLEVWRWRNRSQLDAVLTSDFADVLQRHLLASVGLIAARILAFWHTLQPNAPELSAISGDMPVTLAECSPEIRSRLMGWIDTRGLETPSASPEESDLDTELEESVQPRPKTAPGIRKRLKEIRASEDLDTLESNLRPILPQESVEAILRLEQFGEPGLERVFRAFRDQGYPTEMTTVCVVVVRKNPTGAFAHALARWLQGDEVPSDRRALILTPLLGSKKIPEELQHEFQVALAYLAAEVTADPGDRIRATAFLLRGGHSIDPATAVDIATRVDLQQITNPLADRLWELISATDDPALIGQLVRAPHVKLYGRAVRAMLTESEKWEPIKRRRLLEEFLEFGTERVRAVRVDAAKHLYSEFHSSHAIPILLQAEPNDEPPYPELLVGQSGETVRVVTAGLLMLGEQDDAEEMLVKLLEAEGVDLFEREDGYAKVIQESQSSMARKQARERVRPSYARSFKLRRVADTFAWGVKMGRALLGKLYTIEMTPGEELGFTRFGEAKIFITPLPILRGEFHAEEVVRALILHEYGHHMYHYGDDGKAIWKKAQEHELHGLLNLVSDEHLERNLRALDREFGDQLKQLAAYAFQHTAREIATEKLLGTLGGHAFEVLTQTTLSPARKFGCVGVNNGRLLMQMERAGMSFSRFIRALRMGLGDRHGDPKVRQGLDLFKGKFRKASMDRLYEIAEELRRIFGWEADLLDSFSQDASLCAGDDEIDADGEGITNAEIQNEVRDTLQGKQRKDQNENRRGGHGMNLGPDEDFYTIHKVVPIAHDPTEHAKLARRVRRPAERMRGFFREMGLSLQPQRLRLRGRSFDRTRARAVVLRGDPRMLIARETQIHTDLFLGVVVDCSGSMSYGDRMDRARLFGTLLTEAAKGQAGIDVRVFGFTDQVIYDAGSGQRSAAHGLEAGGGNNDAAGLWHAAQAARASNRRAKLLVMISDGAPTECTVAALRGLVNRLTHRWKMVCAQVAVCPLREMCFPHYVLLDDSNVDAVVDQFGQVVARLVTRALRGG